MCVIVSIVADYLIVCYFYRLVTQGDSNNVKLYIATLCFCIL